MRATDRLTSIVGAATMLLVTAGSRPASAAWPAFGRAITTAASAQVHSAITTDGADGAIITWQDFRFPRVNIFAGHVLASGELDLAWPNDGLALLTDPLAMASADGGQTSPVIASDGAAGAFVAWQDNRSPVTETDIFAQHVLASGVVDGAWPANGLAVSAAAGPQNTLNIVSDGAGGAILTWMDTRPGATVVDVYAQHVLGSGVVDPRWPVNGLAVGAAAGRQEFPTLIADGGAPTGAPTEGGSGSGAIIAWDDDRNASTGFDIYAQHVLNSGVADPAWPVGGRALCIASGDQGFPTLTPDGAHGAIVAWSDSRVVGTSHIFAQHVLASGAVDPAWPVDGTAISAGNVLETRPIAVSDGAGGAVVTWQGFTVHLNMYAQHVKATGVVDPAWAPGGRALSDTERQQSHADAVADGAGGAVVAWEDNSDIAAQHVLASGALDPAYPDTFLAVCNLPSAQGDVALVATSRGGAIVAWTDGRNATTPDIFAMQVLSAVTTDVPHSGPPTIGFARPSPNPTRDAVALRFVLPRGGHVRMAIFDVGGRRVRELVSGPQGTGEHALAWDLRDEAGRAVGAGLYFARLVVDGQALTRTIVAMR